VTARLTPDLCVLGGGSAGLSVAAGAAQMGARVVLLEGGRMGGDCLNHGCVPSKALLAAAKHAHAMTAGGAFGIAPEAPRIDFAAVKDHVRRVIDGIAPHDSVERFEGLGVTVIRDFGSFVSPTEVRAGATVIAARRFVVATGSRPAVPPIPGLDRVDFLTNETIFDLRDRPEHLVIVGGGPVGLEMAQAHRRLGCRVTVLEAARALGREDPEMAGIVLDALRGEGIDLREETAVAEVAQAGDGIAIRTAQGDTISASHLLIATGRVPNTETLGLDVAGIRSTPAGIVTDAGLRTTNRRVYAIGDVTDGPRFTHVAGYQAGLVIRSALFGLPVRASMAHVPWATYTDPELAQVGLTEAAARERHGGAVEVLLWDYAENDRARTEGRTTGRIKVMVRRGRPVGATIVGAQAGELIGLWALAIGAGLKIGAVAGMVAPYPTLTELSKRAAGQYFVPRLFESALVRRIVRFVQRLP
jgi:pyruvate/2-oxoglutarate dehydrogenase complex dihydrolipoamide dehydrogenase (E3) component